MLASLPLLAGDIVAEGKNIITVMLVTGLVFAGVIALGQLAEWLRHRRRRARTE